MKFTRLLVLSALVFLCSSVAKAVDGNVWQKPAFPAMPPVTEFTTYQEGVTVYLYNVKTGLFFVSGNNWATRASLVSATGGNGDGATAGEAIKGAQVTFTSTDAAKALGEDVVELKNVVVSKGTAMSAFADGPSSIWCDNDGHADRFWKVTANGDSYRISNVLIEPNLVLGWNGTDTRLYLVDPAAEGVGPDWKMVAPEVYDTWIAGINDSHLTAIKDWQAALKVYDVAMQLKEQLDKAEQIGADVTEQIAVYNNTNSTIDELNAAIAAAKDIIAAKEKEQASGGLEKATAAAPVDATAFIVNPSFDGDDIKTGWSGSGWGSYGPKENAERYNMTYDTYQAITGLPKGVYALGANAFYRAGDANPAYTNFKAKNEASKYAKLYITNGVDTMTTNIASPFKDCPTEATGQGSESNVKDGDVTYYIPNNMVAAEYYMHTLGLYKNKVFGILDSETLTIGALKKQTVSGDWSIFDDFSLTYYGNGADAYQLMLDETLKQMGEITIGDGTIYTASYLDNYKQVTESGLKATNADEFKAAIAKVEEVAGELQKNIDLWGKYQELAKEAENTAGNPQLDEEYAAACADAAMDVDDDVKAAKLNNEELNEKIAALQSAITEAQRHYKEGADVTFLMVNPGFDTNDDTGWTGRSSITNISANCAEAYEKKNFDFYQVIKGATIGVYEISLQGFYRLGPNETAWADYQAKEAMIAQDPSLKMEDLIPPVAWVYMNQKKTPLNNCYDVKEMKYADFDMANLIGPAPYGSTTTAGDSVYFANGMSTSQDAFKKGYYKKSAFGLVAREGDEMRVGIKGSLGTSQWAIWDNFQLTYRGMKADVVAEVVKEEIANAEAKNKLTIGTEVHAMLNDAIQGANAVLTSTDGKEMFDALLKLFEASDSADASKEIFVNLESSYSKLVDAMATYGQTCSEETYLEAAALRDDVATNMAENYTNADANDRIAKIALMIQKLGVPAGMDKASDENPVDCSGLIQNNNYNDANNDSWTMETGSAGFGNGLIECYNSNFNEYQDLEGLPAGTYEVSVQGFYRFGSATNDYSAYLEDATLNNNLKLYAQSALSQGETAMPRLATSASDYVSTGVASETDGTVTYTYNPEEGKIWVVDPVPAEDKLTATGKQVANNMATAAADFEKGLFLGSSVIFKVGEDGKARIGLKKEVQQDTNWCIWDNWKLTYYGANSAKEPTDIFVIPNNAPVMSTEYFNLNGSRVSAPGKGVAIIKQTLSDGTVRVKKVVIR